jgi:hypothetical protein
MHSAQWADSNITQVPQSMMIDEGECSMPELCQWGVAKFPLSQNFCGVLLGGFGLFGLLRNSYLVAGDNDH